MPLHDDLSVKDLVGKYSYATPYEPGSPWSLVIALLPETVDPQQYMDAVDGPESSLHGEPIGSDLGEFVRQETRKALWSPEHHSGSPKEAFTIVRVRQNDAVCGNLSWPVQTAWYAGVAYVLKLYRSYYHTHLSLKDFEAAPVDAMVEEILRHSSLGHLERDVKYLVLPYLTYHKRIEVLQEWAAKQPLASVKPLAALPPLVGTLLRLCYQAPGQDWRAVKDVQVHLKALAGDAVTLTSIYEPKDSSVAFLGDLASAARILGSLSPASFEILAQWSFASSDVQRGIFNSYLKHTDRWNSITGDLQTLRKTVFSQLTDQEIDNDLLIGALHSGKFMFLQSQDLAAGHIIEAETARIVAQFKEDGHMGPQFSTVLAALDVVPKGRSLDAVKRQFAALKTASVQFKVDPVIGVHLGPLEVVRRALELNPDAYPRVTELTRIANELAREDVGEQVKEACVNSSLASGDFSTAFDLCQTLEGPSAWVAYLQAAKFVSPAWDTKPHSVLEKQKQLAIKCLQICPKSDIGAVARTWESLEAEMQLEHPGLPETAAGSGPRTRKRDQLQKLVIGGLGWAIGAPKE